MIQQTLVIATAICTAKQIRIAGAEASHIDGELVHLVLEQDDPQGPLQCPLLQVVVEGNGLFPAASADVVAYAIVSAHAGPHCCDFSGHVRQIHGLDARDGLDLGCRLHLEDADGVCPVEHGVDLRVFEVDAGQVHRLPRALLDLPGRILHLGQRSQSKEVNLHKPSVFDRVLVPLTDVPTLHGAGLDGHHIDEGRGADDHAPRVLCETSRKPVQLVRQIQQVTPARRI